jgi:hypothetical protein
VILFLKTRPNLLLMTPPPDFNNPFSPTLNSPRQRGGDDQFAHSLSRSFENGHHWVDEDHKSTVEGYERTLSDGGRMVTPEVVRMTSFLDLEGRLPNGQLITKS